MEPYIKANSKLRGPNRPKTNHGPGQRRVKKTEVDQVKAAKRALKKAARQEGKEEIKKAITPYDPMDNPYMERSSDGGIYLGSGY
jgi:hypothetical protein